MRCVRVGLVLVTTLWLAATPAEAQAKSSRRTTAEALKQKGLQMVKFIDVDMDGDGRKELMVVGRDKDGLRLVLVGENPEGAVVVQVLPPAQGKEIASFVGQAMLPPATSQQVVLEVYDETPDEKVKRVRVYAANQGVLREVFTSVINRGKKAGDRPEWERDASIIQYGDARPGWYFEDVEEDGLTEVVVRKRPQIVTIDGKDGPVKLLTGVREQLWRWDDANFAYQERGERLSEFLPAQDIADVTASSAWIEPNELKELKANALNDALMKDSKPGKEGAMGGEFDFGLEDLDVPTAPKPAKPAKPAKAAKSRKPKVEATEPKVAEPAVPEPEIDIDRTPFMRFAADRNLSTGWIEDVAGPGKGEWVEFELEEAAPVKMVRVVSGCVDTKQSFAAHNVPESFAIRLDNGSDGVVDRREPELFDKPVVAFADNLVKLKDRPWAKTTLIFFDGKREAKKVRITLDKVIKQGKGDLTCISEVSIH